MTTETTYDRWADERGEGVISAAIAVLVMACIGVGDVGRVQEQHSK